jgi:hypothetical protein
VSLSSGGVLRGVSRRVGVGTDGWDEKGLREGWWIGFLRGDIMGEG